MTNQIVIKLNEKKFKPLLDKLKSNGHGAVRSYSELVGKIIFFEHLLWEEKCKEFNDKTRMQFLMDKLGETHAEFMKCFLKQYIKFISSGKTEKEQKKCSSKPK